ncbi:MAG TPA: imidazoleglycerol-phosphate dehydratase HisB [Candidatus Acidoferrales bacterium]|nr:imidazoleglycerol-phosphate dehydratase HisB [Candidatus Acidoferrales bacterium]
MENKRKTARAKTRAAGVRSGKIVAVAPTKPARSASVERKTRETSVAVTLKLDGSGRGESRTGVPFLDHMIESFARHGFFDLSVEARGDLHIDEHHTVEDVGIVLGRAFRTALGDRGGIRRFGEATVPLDEAVCTAIVDISGRSYLGYNVTIAQERVGNFQTELVHDFMKALTDEVGMNLHLNLVSGRNPHHIIEAAFKALARAMDSATAVEPRLTGVLSTKGTLS